jgi:uncharacterized protein YndB with AHSA1/START domain
MNKDISLLEVTTPTDREIVMKRRFRAPRELVFKALTKPNLVQRWLLGPDGWKMVVCEIDLRVGGAYRYEWRHEVDGREMAMGGFFLEIAPPERIVSTEKFDESWYPGEATGTTTLSEVPGGTLLTLAVLYDSKDVRDAVLRTPMDEGVGASYDRLETMLDSESP